MSIRRLRTFIKVAEEGSFTAAANVAFVTHATVSQQMKHLEDELGVSLFDRSTRVPRLTELGKRILQKARDVVERYDAMVPDSMNLEIRGELSFGAVPTSLSGLVPIALKELQKRHDSLHVRVYPGLSIELISQVERGVLDAAIVTKPVRLPHNVQFTSVALESIELIASAEEHLADPLEIIRTRPFIRFSRRALVGSAIDEWLQKQKIPVQETMELESLDTIATMVSHNLGVSMVPRSCVSIPDLRPVKRFKLENGPVGRDIGLINRRNTTKAPLIDLLAATLTDTVGRES
jgi:DNA-binding transcriptional LysR family regulator